MEKIKKLNLEISLFIKELHSYTQNVNEIDDETIKLLTETILAVNKLQINSKYREASTTNENNFVHNLNDDIFRCRRNIVCCLCHDTIPLNSEDFEAHIQKYSHKEKEIELRTVCQNGNGTHMLRKTSVISVNSTNSTNGSQSPYLTTASSTSSVSKISDKYIEDQASVNSADIIASIASVGPRIPPTPVAAAKLVDVIKVEHILGATVAGTSDLMSRMETRIKNETNILSLLTRYLKAFDSTLEVIPFGSTTYGFGESKTNFNILVNAGRSKRHPFVVLNSFERSLKLPTTQGDFEVLDSIIGDRVQTKRLQVIHIESGILCWIQCGINFELAASSQVIRDCNINEPLCYHMIAHIRSWKNELNDVAAQNGLSAFQFNTYIISVLVIFFLQVNRNFPKLKNLPSTQFKSINHVPIIDKKMLMQMVHEFFEFYGEKYVISNHVISVNIGRWQELQLNSQQVNLTPEQNSLRDGIESNAFNWKNCTMYVQDIKSSGLNIAAEISSEEAYNFKHFCQVFSHGLCEIPTAIDNFKEIVKVDEVSILSKSESLNSVPLTVKVTDELTEESLLQSLKVAVASIGYKNNKGSTTSLSTSASVNSNVHYTNVNSNGLSTRKLENFIKVEEVFKSIKPEMDEILSRSTSRIDSEQEIINLLSLLMKGRESVRTISTFGSVTFGFGGPKTNLNIFFTSDQPSTSQASFEKYIRTSALQPCFEFLGEVKSNRVHKQQLKIVHKKSGIPCILQFDTESALLHFEKTTKILLDYIRLHPMCKPLIAYMKAWQNVLNEVAAKNRLVAFQFNTYIISVLVIFYLQTNHGLPAVSDLPPAISNKLSFSSQGDLTPFIRGFFEFYGKTFDSKSDLISVIVGRWQKKVQKNQKYFSPEQKRMRNGITECPANWQNCTMCVQDLISACTNITAEISKQEVDNFVKMCQMFEKCAPKFNAEYPSSTLL